MAEVVNLYDLIRKERGAIHANQNTIETIFHMLKTKFGDSVNTKNEHTQFNEMLLKILCHNVVVVIHELQESEIDPSFLADELDTASEMVC